MALRLTEFYKPDTSRLLKVPVFLCRVPAGFPSPADDFLEEFLDLNRKFITNESATFIVRAQGDSMRGAGIHPDDYLIVDRSITPTNGRVVIARLNNEFMVKRYRVIDGRIFLVSENPNYAPIAIVEGHELVIWGVVVHCIHTV